MRSAILLFVLTIGAQAVLRLPQAVIGVTATNQSSARSTPGPAPTKPTSTKTDATVAGVAKEFSDRLRQNVGGRLVSMTERAGTIEARWTSPKCDWAEPEVIDLLLSVNREFRSAITRISGQRECAGRTRTYTLSGADFERYRKGQINDAEVLKA